jgi:hypothetical protein
MVDLTAAVVIELAVGQVAVDRCFRRKCNPAAVVGVS